MDHCQKGDKASALIREGINRLYYHDRQLYYVYVPSGVLDNPGKARLLVSVHGYSGRTNTSYGRGRVKRQVEYWTALAQLKNWIVLAPHFSAECFDNDYQRLNLKGSRADVRLNSLIDELGQKIPGLYTSRFFLFGFSGGGQFVHRYCAFHPSRVKRAVAGAPGWYLWPDKKIPYPVGLGLNHLGDGLRIDFREFCRLRLLILVGKNDSIQGHFKLHYGKYNLLDLQGRGRYERAKRWFGLMHETAIEAGYAFNLTLKAVPGTAHKINRRILDEAEFFLKSSQNVLT